MKKLNFAVISDILFFSLCAFILAFTLVRYYMRSALAALVIALGAAATGGVAAYFILTARRRKKLILTLSENRRKTLSLHLSVSPEGYVKNLFENALDCTYQAGNRLESQTNAYFLFFKMSPLSPDEVAKVISFESDKSKVILCCVASADALSLASDFNVEVKAINAVYALLEEKNLLPEKYALGEIKKAGILKRIKSRFNRKLAPTLFFCGLTLALFSFFTFYPVYYITAGGLLLSLSAVSVLIGQPS